MAMVAGVAGGEILRSTSIIVDTTISRGITTLMPKDIKITKISRIRTGSITLSTEGAPSIGIRQRPRSMGSSVRVQWGERQHQRPGAMGVAQAAVESLKRVTAAVAQGQVAAEDLRRVTLVAAQGQEEAENLSRAI